MSNQQHGHGFPPPPPPPSAVSPSSPYFITQQRRRPAAAQPPSITTNFLRTQGVGSQSQSPASALVPPNPNNTPFQYSPATPVALNPRTAGGTGLLDSGSAVTATPRIQLPSPGGGSPSMAQQPYNPRQWSGHGSHLAYSQQPSPLSRDTREVTGMEAAMPSPPPPYSPETPDNTISPLAIRPSPMLEQAGFVTSPLAVEASSSASPFGIAPRNSPQMPMSPAFPPPPGQSSSRHRERSASGQRLFNTIQSFTSRGKQPVSNEMQASQSVHYPQPVEDIRPPAARRAASTGHMYPSSSTPPPARVTPGPSTGRSSPEGGIWQPGMPLPGPPPGPPPPGARSQSLNRYPPTSSRSNSVTSDQHAPSPPPQQRRAAQRPTLGPVPPTPADWVDQDSYAGAAPHSQISTSESDESRYQPLRINTGAHREQSLTRRPARRDTSSQGIRERRSKSRAARDPNSIMSPVSDDSRPGDLVLSTLEGSIKQRREHMRKASGYSSLAPARTSPEVEASSVSRPEPSSQPSASILTPPYTPAVGGQTGEGAQRRPLAVPSSASSDRPISHLLHAPNDDTSAMPAPLSPARPASNGSMKATTKLEPFYLQAMERHRAFVEKESQAATDEERLELFANYLVHESRLRRDRYSVAYNAMAGDVVDMTRDMWRSYTRMSKRAVTPSTSMSSFDHTIPSWASDGQPASAHRDMPSSASSMGEFTPATDTGSMGDVGDLMDRERQWGEQFKPSLSPIPSMAVSTVPDEDSSRGRAPSRWWEKSDTGSVGRPDRIVKSHRETKYMGVTAADLQDSPHPSPGPVRSTPTPGTSSFTLGPNEYPPEKTGWHDGDDFNTPMATPARIKTDRSAPTPSINQLDVSRLITLPPPYPRHHPAVNNSHPLLSDLRTTHRQLANHDEIQRIRDAYIDRDWALQRSQQEESKQRRTRLRTSVQEKLNSGTISFAEAARAEADFDAAEADRTKSSARANFDAFEAAVSHPLNNVLTARLETANKAITTLHTELDSQTADPNQAQEEGDELPERLEKLTLLKWLHEAREGLHKEMFDLHAQRGEKYAEVILIPYRIDKQTAKIAEAEAFFAKDSRERVIAESKASLTRSQELEDVVSRNVARGVEDQLSAFWDIAPGLLEVVASVPTDEAGLGLGELEVQIPREEYEENPALREWPLQYLYSLLSHAEKSAYQFIESQVNLLCLLHEVRGVTAKSRRRVHELENSTASGRPLSSAGEGGVGREEEAGLDADLKEKVGEVERQWRQALGEGLVGCRNAVREWLEERGGWVEGLEG